MKTIALLMLAMTLTGCGFAQITPYSPPTNKWSATLKVVDDAGSPVDKANVQISYMIPPPLGKGGWGTYGNYGDKIEGITDTNGIFMASHSDSTHGLGFHIEKPGYYKTFYGHEMGLPERYNFDKWNPSLTLTLKKIGQPIAMYARKIQIEVPETNAPAGFDLIVSDWVAPHGKGRISDLVFEVQRRWTNRKDFDTSLKLSFSNPDDGIIPISVSLSQGSVLRLPAIPPVNGYISELIKNFSHIPGSGWKIDENKEQNYYLRVRSVRDANGRIKNAFYGKIHGDIVLDPINSKTTWIVFTYYLNPIPNDQNVEFDPKQNLLKNLKDVEQVREP